MSVMSFTTREICCQAEERPTSVSWVWLAYFTAVVARSPEARA
jgi:hypothetical protein